MRDESGDFALMLMKLRALPQPTVALVHGVAVAGGMGLVSACDIAICTENAVFGLSEVRLGILPAVIGPYVVEAIGPGVSRFAPGDRVFGLVAGGAYAEELVVHEREAVRTPEALKRWYLSMINEIAGSTGQVFVQSIEGLGWGELDFPADLDVARVLVREWDSRAARG